MHRLGHPVECLHLPQGLGLSEAQQGRLHYSADSEDTIPGVVLGQSLSRLAAQMPCLANCCISNSKELYVCQSAT